MRQQKTQTSVTVPNDLSDAPINRLGNQRHSASVAHQVIVAPNNDTLYSMAHLDLSKGALLLHVPAVPHHHYYVFEFLDPYTNVFHYIGTRTTGDGAGNYAIVGPKFHGKLPAGVHRITSKYEHVWVAGLKHSGWYVAPSDIGRFGTDYSLRAVVAVYGIAANIPAEATYPVGSFDSHGALLDGANRYVIHIPRGGFPPVKHYWSFTAHNKNLFLVRNPINRLPSTSSRQA